MVWLFPNKSRSPTIKRPRSVRKTMIACFFGKSGHLATVLLRTDGQSMRTGTCITASRKRKVFEVWCQRHPQMGLCGLFLHDNASVHTAATTVDFLNDSEVQLLPHPPYSPDLSPCNFYLFPKNEKQLNGIVFESAEDTSRAFKRAVEDIPRSTWAEEWNKWFHF